MDGEEAREPLPTRQRRLTLAGMMLGLSVAAFDQMILATASTAISADLGGLAQLPWIFSAYLLSSSCTMPLWGRLGDLHGRRRVFQIAIGLFIGASLLSGASPNMEFLVGARVLQGIGGGGLMTLPNAIVADLVEPRQRTSYYALNTGVWAVAGLLGPLAGGFLTDAVSWRVIFYINAPIGILAIALVAAGYRVPHRTVQHAVDYGGAALLAGSVGALLLLCSGAGADETGIHGLGLVLIAVMFLCALLFVAHEWHTPEPLAPFSVLRVPTVRVGMAMNLLYGLANFAVAIFVPLFAITVAGTSATEAGLRLMPVPVGLLIGNLIVGRLIERGGNYRLYPAAGLAIHIVALFLFTTLDPETPRATVLLYSLMAGVGSGGVTPVLTYALQQAVPANQVGLVTALPTFGRAVAQSVGIAALGSFLALRLDTHLRRLVPDPPIDLHPDTLRARAEDIRSLGEPLSSAVVEACRVALSEVFLVMAGIMALTLLVSLRLRPEK
jgi:EmrB/QacA subfamily drug resistance transporter